MPTPNKSMSVPLQPTAVVYCEANFGSMDGKTANGLVRHSEKYKILSVIDSTKAGMDSGTVLDEKTNGLHEFLNDDPEFAEAFQSGPFDLQFTINAPTIDLSIYS